MKSNRQAAKALGLTHYHSNTRIITMRGALVQVNPSRRQQKANQRHYKWLRENADYSCDYAQGQHTQGEGK